MAAPAPPSNAFNVNVGVLGHVDSGKTSLVAALSTTLSTAALDKHPQSKERGITLDLGFSSFLMPCESEQTSLADQHSAVQFTLVDCPGHASLIRTVIGGAQIMDMAILVVDVNKGIQAQTAECIVVAEITTDTLVVVLNKIDQLDPEKRDRHIRKASKLVAASLAATKFAGCPIVALAARPQAVSNALSTEQHGAGEQFSLDQHAAIERLKATLLSLVRARKEASLSAPFLFYIDHCFAIKGQGTVITGTVARGRAAVGDIIELPTLKQRRKIKSIQIFRRPATACSQGDRAGVCVTQLDPNALERGLASAPDTVPTFSEAILQVHKVRFYQGHLRSGVKLHIISGHQTVMATLTFFGGSSQARTEPMGLPSQGGLAQLSLNNNKTPDFDLSSEYLYQDELEWPGPEQSSQPGENGGSSHHGATALWWAYVRFDEPITAPLGALVVGARLDADVNGSSCRIALWGNIVVPIPADDPAFLRRLLVYKKKQREGSIERVESDGCTAICRGMFGKDSDMTRFLGLRVCGPNGKSGIIQSTFGKSGKFKVRFAQGITIEKGKNVAIVLEFKRYLFETDKRRIVQ